MKKILVSISLFITSAVCVLAQQTPKYVFYFIGDGMGVNQVNGTETYMAAIEGRIGTKPLTFADFPYTAMATTYSASNGITDSAAGGTALATGAKTYNGCLGLRPDSITPVSSVAVWAKKAGAAVGVSTSVSVDHATPASFYAHQKDRGMYYEVGLDLIKSGFDFFAGSDFLKPESKTPGQDLYTLCQNAGYTIARGYKDYQKKTKKADRMIMFQTEAASKVDRTAIPYAIDRKKGDMTLQEITRAGINFLYKKNPDKFFLMVEGGKIDWACHANDAATTFLEIMDMDDAVRVAYEFYCQHPDETLIVITADHETGGLGLGNGDYVQRSQYLRNQSMSAPAYSDYISNLRKKAGSKFTYQLVKEDLKKNFGFWKEISLDEYQEDQLQRAFDKIVSDQDKGAKSMYASESAFGNLVKSIINRRSRLGWTSGSHTNGYVPVFAIGAGAETFHGRINNIDIPVMIGKVAGYCTSNPND